MSLLISSPCRTDSPSLQPDVPLAGQSRFDELIGNGPVPYPFSRLVRVINRQMLPDPGGLPPLKSTLIPMGRSLQRDAGAPAFFRFPRVVAAADGDTRPGYLPLKDRLFLGYHEAGHVLEVISYNDAAGRFEFQVVHDYRAGKTPQVVYARRSLCLACHQNGAPIFARPLWDETPANPEIAQRLRETRRNFYDLKLTGTDIAYFIDASTDRANLFSTWQTLWQQGCGEGERGDRCRMDALAGALEYALSRALPVDNALPTLAQNWKTVWPQGLSIPNADLPNRNPLARLQSAVNDPLLLRPPLTTWHAPDRTAFIVGLADMLDPAAVKRLGQRDLAAALEKLRARGGLAAKPFSQSVLADLQRELDIRIQTRPVALPAKRTEPVSTPHPTHARFHAHCASCHATSLPHPPNFMYGSPAQVEAQLAQCAPRMFVRLSMAEAPESARSVSPMPPAAALVSRGIAPHQWVKSAEFSALRQSIESRLRSTPPERLLRQPYASLPPCLSQPSYARHAP